MLNKKMILMLVLLTAALASTAQAGDYKVYGKLHTSVDMLSDSNDSQVRLVSNTSKFGLKGAQELNESLTFIWQFEQKLNIAQKGNQTLANRNSFIGMKGEWGQVRLGIHDTPFKVVGRKATFFFDEIGDQRTATMGWDRRLSDIVAYVSPDFNGLTFFGAYHLDQNPLGPDQAGSTFDEAASAVSANAMYNRDGIVLGVAVENLSKGFAPQYDMTDPDNPVLAGYGESQMGVRFAGKYTLEQFALSFLYQSLTDVGGVADKKATTLGFEGKFQFDTRFAFKGAYYMADPDTDSNDDDYSLLALGVDHNYAKNLGFYLQYAMVMNADMSDHALAGVGHGTSVGASAMGENPTGFSVGSWFKF